MDTIIAVGLLLAVVVAWQEDRATHGDINRTMGYFFTILALTLVLASLLE